MIHRAQRRTGVSPVYQSKKESELIEWENPIKKPG